MSWIVSLCLAMSGLSGWTEKSLSVALATEVWHTNYQAARTIARETGQPLLVVFR